MRMEAHDHLPTSAPIILKKVGKAWGTCGIDLSPVLKLSCARYPEETQIWTLSLGLRWFPRITCQNSFCIAFLNAN